MKKYQIFEIAVCLWFVLPLRSQVPFEKFLQAPCMQGASFSFSMKEVQTGKTVYSYDPDRLLTPASVMKVVTTATALELLGADYRYPTGLEYDGTVRDGVLQGNLYIKGSGDPSLGSGYLKADFLDCWVEAVREAGIRRISGSVIADEQVFDAEGVSTKWLREDMGNYYAAGSYGLSVFDNSYRLTLRSGAAGTRPVVVGIEPQVPVSYENHIETLDVRTDSVFIVGMPFDSLRYLYGVLPPGRERCVLKGDIPDPPLFLAACVTDRLRAQGIRIDGMPSSFRIEQKEGRWKERKRTRIITTYSPPLEELVSMCNHVSHNLFADAFLKTAGLHYQPGRNEMASSFTRGVRVLEAYWRDKGMKTGGYRAFDGSGLALADKLSASFVVDLLVYMATKSDVADVFIASLPEAGREGSVRNFLKGTALEGYVRMKSGSMSAVRCYAGYLWQSDKLYAVAILVNNYEGGTGKVTKAIERLLLQLAAAIGK